MSLMPYEDQARFEEMDAVMKLYVKNVNPTAIARELGIRRVDVLEHVDNWRKSAVHSETMKDRVDELISTMDEHYGILIQKAYEIIEEVDRPLDEDEKRKETMTRSQMLSQKKGALDLIAKLEKDRIDILQKSGLLEAADLGDELVDMEERQRSLIKIITEELCNSCKPRVMARIHAVMQGHTDAPVVVESEIVDGEIIDE